MIFMIDRKGQRSATVTGRSWRTQRRSWPLYKRPTTRWWITVATRTSCNNRWNSCADSWYRRHWCTKNVIAWSRIRRTRSTPWTIKWPRWRRWYRSRGICCRSVTWRWNSCRWVDDVTPFLRVRVAMEKVIFYYQWKSLKKISQSLLRFHISSFISSLFLHSFPSSNSLPAFKETLGLILKIRTLYRLTPSWFLSTHLLSSGILKCFFY